MKKTIFVALFALLTLFACQSDGSRSAKANNRLGSRQNPIKMYFVPSLEAGKVVRSGEDIAKALQEKTGYHFKVAVPTSYAAVIEALGSYQCDIAWLPTYAYVLAHDKHDAKVRLITVRDGRTNYRGQFVAKDKSIRTINDLQGKVVAYTDAASASGYIYPSAMLKHNGITLKNHIFAGGHPQAILAVYSGQADAATTYWSPLDSEGNPTDARERLLETHPDIFEKIHIIGYTEWIPNDTVTFRKNMPPELEDEVVSAIHDFSITEEGVKILQELYDVDGLDIATDKDYDVVRDALRTMNMDPESFLK